MEKQREDFCRWLNAAIAEGRQFAFVVVSEVNGQSYGRSWPLMSIKDIGNKYEIHLHGYGAAAVPYSTRFLVVSP